MGASYAPVKNYVQLLSALHECWINEFLPPHRIVQLIETLFGSFIRTDRANGYMLAISDEDRDRALESISKQARTYAAAIVYVGLRQEPGIPTFIFDWQPFIVAGLELDLFEVNDDTAELAQMLLETGASDNYTHADVSPSDIDEHLEKAATYINDRRFCEILARDLGFERAELLRIDVNKRYGATLSIEGSFDPLEDSRVVTAIRRTLEYRSVHGLILIFESGQESILLNGRAYALIDGIEFESSVNIDGNLLRNLEQRGLGLGPIMETVSAAAS